MKKNQKGFTLVELLVVVAIIVVLAGVLLLAINPAALLAKGRDARRLEDIEALNKALALSLADGEITLTATGACATCTSLSGTQVVTGGGWVKYTLPAGKTGLGKYLAALPIDPLNTGTNVYTFASTLTNYELNLVLESADNAAKMTTDGGNAADVLEVGTSLIVL